MHSSMLDKQRSSWRTNNAYLSSLPLSPLCYLKLHTLITQRDSAEITADQIAMDKFDQTQDN